MWIKRNDYKLRLKWFQYVSHGINYEYVIYYVDYFHNKKRITIPEYMFFNIIASVSPDGK